MTDDNQGLDERGLHLLLAWADAKKSEAETISRNWKLQPDNDETTDIAIERSFAEGRALAWSEIRSELSRLVK